MTFGCILSRRAGKGGRLLTGSPVAKLNVGCAKMILSTQSPISLARIAAKSYSWLIKTKSNILCCVRGLGGWRLGRMLLIAADLHCEGARGALGVQHVHSSFVGTVALDQQGRL